MADTIFTRMGDGMRIRISPSELKDDIQAGMMDAVEMAQIPELTAEDLEALFDIFADSNRTVSVRPGNEVVTTDDAGPMSFYSDQTDAGAGIPMSRILALQTYERACAGDTMSMGPSDCSVKPAKPIITWETQEYYTASLSTIAPIFYAPQPNLGLYFQPEGPYPNPSELMPVGKIQEAQDAQLEAAEHLKNDMVFIGQELNAVGCEGINFDTAASAGDPDFLATLQAIETLKKEAPHMAIEIGMSNEFVMGMHGNVTYQGQRLAGMFPHQQVKVAEAAGADIFGPAINSNTSRTTPWNVARAVTFVKATAEAADIPIHPNAGIGVGGIPMFELPSIDCVSRASKALVEIGKADGL